MVRFSCEYCGHKISVQDKHAGKRGKCPECDTIPLESTVFFWVLLAFGAFLLPMGSLIYVVFVIAHLIGRFYWQHHEKLNWEVQRLLL